MLSLSYERLPDVAAWLSGHLPFGQLSISSKVLQKAVKTFIQTFGVLGPSVSSDGTGRAGQNSLTSLILTKILS